MFTAYSLWFHEKLLHFFILLFPQPFFKQNKTSWHQRSLLRVSWQMDETPSPVLGKQYSDLRYNHHEWGMVRGPQIILLPNLWGNFTAVSWEHTFWVWKQDFMSLYSKHLLSFKYSLFSLVPFSSHSKLLSAQIKLPLTNSFLLSL